MRVLEWPVSRDWFTSRTSRMPFMWMAISSSLSRNIGEGWKKTFESSRKIWHFLLQDRIADLADLEPPKLLRCAEESVSVLKFCVIMLKWSLSAFLLFILQLSREVLEMHDELTSRRGQWTDMQQELAAMREEDERQIIRQNEAEKDARKLRYRNANFERMGAVRLKLLVQVRLHYINQVSLVPK